MSFIKSNMGENINFTSSEVKIEVRIVSTTISYEDTWFGDILKFVTIIWT